MTDKRIKEPCPFCGAKPEEIQIKSFGDGMNKIYCPKCSATFELIASKQNLIDRWNARFK